jgi:hypothetical protein
LTVTISLNSISSSGIGEVEAMARALLVVTAFLIGLALQDTGSANAIGVSDYRRTGAAIDQVERSGLRLGLIATEQLATPREGARQVYAQVVVTDTSLEFLIGVSGKLVSGDLTRDLEQLAQALDELKAQKAALLGQLGDEARTEALTRAHATSVRVVDIARHMRTVLDCLDCD